MQSSTLDCRPYDKAFRGLAADLPATPRLDLPGFFAKATELSAKLPAEVIDALAAFRAEGNEEGYLLLRNLPIDESALPSTPEHWKARLDRSLVGMEPWISLVGMRLGVATGYPENREGAVFQDVFPARGQSAMTAASHRMSAHGHEEMLRWHTEMAYMTGQPNYLVIGCARADHEKEAVTPVVSIRKIIHHLSDTHREILRTLPLTWHVDDAFKTKTNPDPVTKLLLLAGNDDILRYDGGLIIPAEVEQQYGPEARHALETFAKLANQMRGEVTLVPGDIIVIDNMRTAHARTKFTPRFSDDPNAVNTNRWLNRIFVRTPGVGHGIDLPHAEQVPFKLQTPELRR